MNQHFEISGDYIELNKLLKASGLCGTGGEAKNIIKDGLVLVDNQIEMRIRRKLKDGMIVQFNSQSIKIVFKKS